MHKLMSTINYHPEAEYHPLRELVNTTHDYYLRLSELTDVKEIIDQIKGLIEQTERVHELALFELKLRLKPKGGCPPEINREGLVYNLLDIYTRWTGRPIGLSKTQGKPSGPCYRFVTTILQMTGLSITGVEHIIEKAAAHTKNSSQKNQRL
jgi:hypothetical protein